MGLGQANTPFRAADAERQTVGNVSPAIGFGGSPQPVPAFAEEGLDILCGTVTVPEDHANPMGRHIELAVAVIPAWGGEPAAEP